MPMPWQPPERQWQSRLRATGLVLPIAAMIGIVENRRRIDRTEKDRSLNGTAVGLRPNYDRLYAVSFSASGPAIRWSPNFAALPVDGWFTADCTKHMAGAIYAGQSSTVLHRDPVPGTVRAFRALDPEQRNLPIAVDGRAVTLADGAVADANLTVQFLPRLKLCFPEETEGAPEIEGVSSWTLDTEEYQPG